MPRTTEVSARRRPGQRGMAEARRAGHRCFYSRRSKPYHPVRFVRAEVDGVIARSVCRSASVTNGCRGAPGRHRRQRDRTTGRLAIPIAAIPKRMVRSASRFASLLPRRPRGPCRFADKRAVGRKAQPIQVSGGEALGRASATARRMPGRRQDEKRPLGTRESSIASPSRSNPRTAGMAARAISVSSTARPRRGRAARQVVLRQRSDG
jgi:hypothetical protein